MTTVLRIEPGANPVRFLIATQELIGCRIEVKGVGVWVCVPGETEVHGGVTIHYSPRWIKEGS